MKKYILGYIILINFSCKDKVEYDRESIWLLQNEKAINEELERRVIDGLNEDRIDTNWIDRSIVVTQYDTTILGTFAKKISEIDERYEIEYTCYRNLNKKKTITILKDSSKNYKSLPKKNFLIIDSTKYFKIPLQ